MDWVLIKAEEDLRLWWDRGQYSRSLSNLMPVSERLRFRKSANDESDMTTLPRDEDACITRGVPSGSITSMPMCVTSRFLSDEVNASMSPLRYISKAFRAPVSLVLI